MSVCKHEWVPFGPAQDMGRCVNCGKIESGPPPATTPAAYVVPWIMPESLKPKPFVRVSIPISRASEPKLRCPECPSVFTMPSDLIEHLQLRGLRGRALDRALKGAWDEASLSKTWKALRQMPLTDLDRFERGLEEPLSGPGPLYFTLLPREKETDPAVRIWPGNVREIKIECACGVGARLIHQTDCPLYVRPQTVFGQQPPIFSGALGQYENVNVAANEWQNLFQMAMQSGGVNDKTSRQLGDMSIAPSGIEKVRPQKPRPAILETNHVRRFDLKQEG